MTSRELPELRFASKCQLRERELKRKAREQDRKSNVVQRQIDRHIYLATQELHDIQTRTLSPSLSAGLPPRITVWEADHNDDLYDVERRRTAAAITTTTTTVRNGYSDLTAGHLVHLRARTRRNLLVSQKLSHSLERLDERRAHSSRPGLSPRDFSSAGTDTAGGNAALRPVSSRSMEELQRAASVLRFTEHEQYVQELLSSVSLKDKR